MARITNASQAAQDNILKIEASLKNASIFTAKMAGDVQTLTKLSNMIGKDSFLGSLANIVAPNTNLGSGINKLVEIYQKGAPNVNELKKQLAASQGALNIGTGDLRAFLSTEFGGDEKIRERFMRQAKAYSQIEDINLRTTMQAKLRQQIQSKEAVDAFKTYNALRDQSREMAEQTEQLSKQAQIYAKIHELHALEKLARSALVGTGLAASVKMAGEFNQALIETNSSMATRRDITYEALSAQIATGASVAETTDILKALTGQAFRTKEEFNAVLADSMMLKDGLGLSAEATSQLARSAALLNAPYRAVADTMATILDTTRLTASEAAGMFSSLSRAYAIIGGADVGVGRSLAGIEGELKAKTGAQGELTAFLGRMVSTGAGAQMAPMFGVNVGQLKTEEGTQALLRNLAARVQRDTAGKGETGRLIALESISQFMTMGTVSALTLSKLAESMRAVNEKSKEKTTLEDRWRDQMTDTMRAVDRLKGSFSALLHAGFLPLLTPIRLVAGWMADLVGILGKIPGAMTAVSLVLGTALTIAAVRAVNSLVSVAVALRALAIEAAVSAGLMKAAGPAGPKGALGRFGADLWTSVKGRWSTTTPKFSFITRGLAKLGLVLRSFLITALTVLTSPPVLLALATVVMVKFIQDYFEKKQREEERKRWDILKGREMDSRSIFNEGRMSAIRTGDPTKIKDWFEGHRYLMTNAGILTKAGAINPLTNQPFTDQELKAHNESRFKLYEIRAVAAALSIQGTRALIGDNDKDSDKIANSLKTSQLPILKELELERQQSREEYQRLREESRARQKMLDDQNLKQEMNKAEPNSWRLK